MDDLISPKYLLKLAKDVDIAIWDEFKNLADVEAYINRWHEEQDYNNWENFKIARNLGGFLDSAKTLNNMEGQLLLKVAIDLGVETPNFIPSIPVFRNEIKSSYKTSYDTFTRAFKMVETDQSTAVGLANSALESIIKEILKNDHFKDKVTGNETLYKLTVIILKEFRLLDNDLPKEIKTISHSFIAINQAIETLRSEKTHFHGKTKDDYLIEDSIYAYFIINAVTTVGLFLMTYFEKKFKVNLKQNTLTDDLPF
jgi:hypothetical protein